MDMEPYIDIPSSMNQPEVFGNYPSDFIKGLDGKWNASAYELTARDKQNIFDALREQVAKDSHGDVDGQIYTVAYKVYDIRAVHHYEPITEMRYDVNFACYEEVQTGCRDSLEIIKVSDEDGRSYPARVQVLNQYAKHNNL